MNVNIAWAILGGGVGIIFGAGVVFQSMQSKIEKARQDVNQLGKKYGRLVAMLILWADTDEKRHQLARATEPQW